MPILRKYQDGGSVAEKRRVVYYAKKRSFPKSIYNSSDEVLDTGRYDDIHTTTEVEKDGNKIVEYRCTGSALDACSYNWRQGWDKELPPSYGIEKVPNNSVDAWEIHKYSRDMGTGVANDSLQANQYPMNTLIGMGDARGKWVKEENEELVPRHTAASIGWLRDGTPLIYSLGMILTPSQLDYNINKVTTPKTTYTFEDAIRDETEYESELSQYNADPLNIDIQRYIDDIKSSGVEVSDRFANDIAEFNSEITSNRDVIMRSTGLTGEGFNELHKQALAIAVQESATSGSFTRAIDDLGSSRGLTQVRNSMAKEMVKRYPGATKDELPMYMDDHGIKKRRTYLRLSDDASGNKSSAVYTMLLLADNAKRLDNVRDNANKVGPGFITEPKRTLNPVIRKLVSVLDIDWLKEDYPTEGNNKALSDEDLLNYMWNNPARLRTGDAQGKEHNLYLKNISKYKGLLKPLLNNEISK